MQIVTKLEKPYTEEQRLDFIVQQSHNLGYEIRETEEALEAWNYTEEEIKQQEKKRIAKLFLTGADVERGIFKARGADFEDIIKMIGQMQINSDPRTEGIELKALKIELKANNFYRGNPYVNAIGALLGFTDEQLDLFFETNDYTVLLPKEEPTEPPVEEPTETPTETPVEEQTEVPDEENNEAVL
jgi:hypothetical protein